MDGRSAVRRDRDLPGGAGARYHPDAQPHGFFGRDAAVAKAMKDWMMGREFPREIQ